MSDVSGFYFNIVELLILLVCVTVFDPRDDIIFMFTSK